MPEARGTEGTGSVSYSCINSLLKKKKKKKNRKRKPRTPMTGPRPRLLATEGSVTLCMSAIVGSKNSLKEGNNNKYNKLTPAIALKR